MSQLWAPISHSSMSAQEGHPAQLPQHSRAEPGLIPLPQLPGLWGRGWGMLQLRSSALANVQSSWLGHHLGTGGS